MGRITMENPLIINPYGGGLKLGEGGYFATKLTDN